VNWLKKSLFLGLITPSIAFADNLTVIDAWIPIAPPGVMSHAAYLTLENTDKAAKYVVSISAEGYGRTSCDVDATARGCRDRRQSVFDAGFRGRDQHGAHGGGTGPQWRELRHSRSSWHSA